MDILSGDVVAVDHIGGSASKVTTATSITAYLGECDSCTRPVRADLPEDKGKVTVIRCPDCGKKLAAERLVAVTTDLVCASECRGAYRKHCECSCAGVNHARIWGMRLKAEDLPESEVLEQLSALVRFRANQVAVLQRLADKQQEAAVLRGNAFNAWIEQGDREMFVADLLECPDTRVKGFQAMVENNEVLSDFQESQARSIIAARGGWTTRAIARPRPF